MPPSSNPQFTVVATVVSVKGCCSAGFNLGDRFPLSCRKTGNMCGFFYASLFADLQTFEFGGRMPWWEENAIELACPDPENQVVLRLERMIEIP